MNYIKIFENFQNIITINQFLDSIGIQDSKKEAIINWWNQNRSHIKIHYFSFNTNLPIAGVFLGVDEIAINGRAFMPPHIRLFLALHESRHCDQHREGTFMSKYYDTVVNGDKESFLRFYAELEKDANDFAINAMRQIGFTREMDLEEPRLRGNERAGEMVYRMMTDDIRRLQPTDFIDLLKKQIS